MTLPAGRLRKFRGAFLGALSGDVDVAGGNRSGARPPRPAALADAAAQTR